MKAILRWLGDEKLDDNVVAVGHRVLHGGRDFTQPARVDAALLATLRTLIPLGELHEPFNILGIEAAIEAFPQDAAGRLLRHRLPPRPTVRRRRLRAAALLLRRRRAPLRLPRPVLRIHRATAEDGRAGDRRRPGRRRPSRQRLVAVRDPQRPRGGDDHGHDPARRRADGHPLRPDRSRRAVLS